MLVGFALPVVSVSWDFAVVSSFLICCECRCLAVLFGSLGLSGVWYLPLLVLGFEVGFVCCVGCIVFYRWVCVLIVLFTYVVYVVVCLFVGLGICCLIVGDVWGWC